MIQFLSTTKVTVPAVTTPMPTMAHTSAPTTQPTTAKPAQTPSTTACPTFPGLTTQSCSKGWVCKGQYISLMTSVTTTLIVIADIHFTVDKLL